MLKCILLSPKIHHRFCCCLITTPEHSKYTHHNKRASKVMQPSSHINEIITRPIPCILLAPNIFHSHIKHFEKVYVRKGRIEKEICCSKSISFWFPIGIDKKTRWDVQIFLIRFFFYYSGVRESGIKLAPSA